MSHSILYNRLFVRLADGSFILCVEAGDNNVYDLDPLTGREKRTRSWGGWYPVRNELSYTRDEVLTYLQKQRSRTLETKHEGESDRDALARFGYYRSVSLYGRSTHTTSFGAFSNFFLSGMDEAVPFDGFVTVFGGFNLMYFNRDKQMFERTGTILTEEELRRTFYEKKALHGTTWVEAPNRYLLTDAARILSPSRKGCTMEVHFQDGEGKRQRKFLKSFFPVDFCETETAARHISKKCDRSGVLRMVDLLMRRQGLPGASGLTFHW